MKKNMESIIYTAGQRQNNNHQLQLQQPQQQQQQPQLQQHQLQQQQPTTSHQTQPQQQQQSTSTTGQQNIYQVKCGLLEYHIQEAILVNKALRSELKQYRDKIEFEKKLRKFLVNRVKGPELDS